MTAFTTPGPVRAHIDIELGDVRVAVGSDGETLVDVAPTDPANERDLRAAQDTRVTYADGKLDVVSPRPNVLLGPSRKSGSLQVSVRVPAGSAVEARTALGLIVTDGSLGEVSAKTSAGDIHIDEAAAADLKTGIGAVTAGRIGGDLRCSTGSGAVRIDAVAGACLVKNSNGDTSIGSSGPSTRVKAANGRIVIDRARGDVQATTANGDLRMGCLEAGSVLLRTSLGSIDLGIPLGTAARLGLRTSFGTVRNGLDAAEGPGSAERTVEIDAVTGAGDITVVRASTSDE